MDKANLCVLFCSHLACLCPEYNPSWQSLCTHHTWALDLSAEAPSHHCRVLGRSCSQLWVTGLAAPHHFSLCVWPAHPQKVAKETRGQSGSKPCLSLCLNTVGSDPEFARYVAGVSQAMQQKRQVQHGRRPGNPRGHWPPMDDAHRTWPLPEFFTEGWVLGMAGKLGLGSGYPPWGLCVHSHQAIQFQVCVWEWHMIKSSGGQHFVINCRMPGVIMCPCEHTSGTNWFLR